MKGSDDSLASEHLRALLALGIGFGWLAAALVLLRDVFPDGPMVRAMAVLGWLIFAPLYAHAFVERARRIPHLGGIFEHMQLPAEALPLLLLPTPLAESLLFGGAILGLGHLFLAHEDDRFAALALAAPPIVVVFGLAFAPSAGLLVLLPATLSSAVCALVLLHGRVAKRRVRRGRTRNETPQGTRLRIGLGVLLSVALLAAGLLLFAGADAGLRMAAASGTVQTRADRPLQPPPPSPAGGEGQGAVGNTSSFAPDLAFSGGAFPFSDAAIMKVRPHGDNPAALGPLHMRDMVLDHFHAGGVSLRRSANPPLLEDADDGEADGWTHAAAPRPTSEVHEYTVLARPLTLTDPEWTLVFSPHPLVAIQLPQLYYHPDQVLATPIVPADWFEYGLRVERRRFANVELGSLPATHPDLQYTQLPDDEESMARIRAYGADVLRGSTTDLDKVLRLVRHFRDEFDYELSHTEFEGPAAIVEFLDRGSGYCTYFASAAALMLRTDGIAARLATGFLARTWSEEDGAWIARERDAHAWLEVHFEGVGWMTFDATPIAGDMGGLSPFDPNADSGHFADALHIFQRWLASGGADAGLGEVLGAGLRGVFALTQTPLAWILAGLAVVVLLVGSKDSVAAVRRIQGARVKRDVFGRLELALARHGFHRRRGQTPREFARHVRTHGGEPFGAVPRAADLLYGVRFGGHALGEEERSFLTGLIRSIDNAESPT
ncbi:MAG: transglutaminase domain-containing protein [bacterium]|nr:transglutaminase domain-containing protein [bacterium]